MVNPADLENNGAVADTDSAITVHPLTIEEPEEEPEEPIQPPIPKVRYT